MKYLTAFFFLTVVTLVFATSYVRTHHFQPGLDAQQAYVDSLKPLILADLQLIDGAALFKKPEYKNNADLFLSQHINWSGQNIAPIKDENLQLANQLLKDYFGWSKSAETLSKLLKDPRLNSINTSWVADLHHYDYWDTSVNQLILPELSRADHSNGISKIGIFAALPIPTYSDLRAMATVHLLQKIKENKPLEGLKTYRKVAELCYSSSLLIGAMNTVVLLNDERFVVEALKIKNWSSVPSDVVSAFKRVSWAWVGLLRNSFNQEIPPEISKYAKVENGICAAAWESSSTAPIQDYLAPQALFEADHSEQVERLQKSTQKFLSECHLESYSKFNERTPASQNGWLVEQSKVFSEEYTPVWYEVANLSRVPYVRRLVMYELFSVPGQYFKQYDQKKM